MTQLTFSLEEHPVKVSPSQDFARDLMAHAETSCSPFALSLLDTIPSGWSGKTSPVSCQATEDGISLPSSGRWKNSGMGGPLPGP